MTGKEMDKIGRYPEFKRSRLKLMSLAGRRHGLSLSDILPLEYSMSPEQTFREAASRIISATECGSSVVLMMGAHVLRDGVQRYLIHMMQKGHLSCIAMNGAGVIHDFEFALVGATTENVESNINNGRFGLWKETGRINDIVSNAAKRNMGIGEAVGRVIEEENFPYRSISVLAAGYRLGIPVTVHVGIGQDILHELPNCNGAAYGKTSYTDFLRFAKVLEFLGGGVLMNFGSAVMGPEVYLKALAMVRNAASNNGTRMSGHTVVVFDLLDLPGDYHKEPSRKDHLYYFRPWKTMLVRTVKNGGESFYINGRHAETLPRLWTALQQMEEVSGKIKMVRE